MEIMTLAPADAVMMTANFAMMLVAVFTYRHALDSRRVLAPVQRPVR